MKQLSLLLIALSFSSACFAVAPFSGKRDYKVGDKEVYTGCLVRAQFDFNVGISNDQDLQKMTAICTNMASQTGVDQTGVTISAKLNGYSQTTVNCIVCPQN